MLCIYNRCSIYPTVLRANRTVCIGTLTLQALIPDFKWHFKNYYVTVLFVLNMTGRSKSCGAHVFWIKCAPEAVEYFFHC